MSIHHPQGLMHPTFRKAERSFRSHQAASPRHLFPHLFSHDVWEPGVYVVRLLGQAHTAEPLDVTLALPPPTPDLVKHRGCSGQHGEVITHVLRRCSVES